MGAAYPYFNVEYKFYLIIHKGALLRPKSIGLTLYFTMLEALPSVQAVPVAVIIMTMTTSLW